MTKEVNPRPQATRTQQPEILTGQHGERERLLHVVPVSSANVRTVPVLALRQARPRKLRLLYVLPPSSFLRLRQLIGMFG
jgi:hypothetical protein